MDRLGIERCWSSDHYLPWWHTGAAGGAAWPWLGAQAARLAGREADGFVTNELNSELIENRLLPAFRDGARPAGIQKNWTGRSLCRLRTILTGKRRCSL